MHSNQTSTVYDVSIELNNQLTDVVILESPLEVFVRDLLFLLTTDIGQIPNLRKVGNSLSNYLQDNITSELLSQIESEVAESITNFLGVKATVKATVSDIDRKTIKLDISFSLPEKRELLLKVILDKFKNSVQITDIRIQQNKVTYKILD